MFQGQYFQLVPRDQFAELIFDSQTDGVNTLNRAALEELEQAIAIISATDIKGTIIKIKHINHLNKNI